MLLRAHEQHISAVRRGVFDEAVRFLETFEGLAQVENVDAVPLTEYERTHLGVPASRLVAEVNSGLQELTHRDSSHVLPPDGFGLWTSAHPSSLHGAELRPQEIAVDV